jgi:hypothetical protein
VRAEQPDRPVLNPENCSDKGEKAVMGLQIKSLVVGVAAGYIIAVYLPKFMSR